MPQYKPFDIPQELRQLAEENVERAHQLYLQFIENVAQTMVAWATPSVDTITPGFNKVRARAVRFAKENAENAPNALQNRLFDSTKFVLLPL